MGNSNAPKEILRLIDQFELHLDSYKSGAYNETQLRREFLDPFFKALGWDVDNAQGLAEAYKDVVHEDAIRIGGAVKAPDYCFRIGGTRKFFLEAKKPSVAVGEETSAAYQLRRYAWSAKLPLSILSDFEEFAVYDCRIKPNKPDSAAVARIFFCCFQDYPEKWEWISSIFSKEAVLKGSFDKYAETNKAKRGTAEVDDDFLATIEHWRSELARNLALRNSRLTQRELNFAVQRIIDRIIFLRICEDRGIELYGRLLALTNGPNIYRRLCEIFEDADSKYNSGLFYFRAEKARHEPPDELTLSLRVDDKLLRDLLKCLYYPESPYEFTVISSDILGQVYEQFLGKVIRLTSGHHAVIEDKPEVKKAGGVYYTPTYIVGYIVRQTVGKLVEGKTPKQVSKLHVLDPACGSGSFLINAYQFLLDWHRDWYLAHKHENWAKGRNPLLVQTITGWKLTISERKRILLDNIYGVDIDPQAVEVTKLSLLLKVLEGESEQTIQPFLRLFQQRALPDLGDNIKCGNSLIGSDFYSQKELPLLDDEERLCINVFDWEAEFSEIMKSGGFDAVIGNPPYVRQEELNGVKSYFHSRYQTFQPTADLYVNFIEKGHRLLKSTGLFGMIVSNKWLRAAYGRRLRRFLADGISVLNIVDMAGLRVFANATVRTIILVSTPRPKKSSTFLYLAPMPTSDFHLIRSGEQLLRIVEQKAKNLPLSSLSLDGWSFSDASAQAIIEKMKQSSLVLTGYIRGKPFFGIKTGLNEAFMIDKAKRNHLIAKNSKATEIIRPLIVGKDVRRYAIDFKDRYLVWTYTGVDIDRYPAVFEHLKKFKPKLKKRWDQGNFWWELRACDYYDRFEKPKIIYPDIASTCRFALDQNGYFGSNTTYFISGKDLYLLGILNSKLAQFYFSKTCAGLEGGGKIYLRFFGQYLEEFPVHRIDLSDSSEVNRHCRIVELVGQMLDLQKKVSKTKIPQEKEALRRQIEAIDRQIDELVYQLYGLSAEEIKIVKEAG